MQFDPAVMALDGSPDLGESFRTTAFRWTFRRYQSLALDAYENRAQAHADRCYLVMPPGSGKTAVGLEIIRREGNPAVVFCPNTAVQEQWQREWANFHPETVPAGVDPEDDTSLCFLTYQSLCNFNPEHEDLDDVAVDLWAQRIRRERGLAPADARAEIQRMEATDSRQYRRDLRKFRSQARRMIANGDDPESLLDLLHPNGQALVERIAEWDRCTLVLDECHHLLEMWGHLVNALVERLGNDTMVVGLTATPPRDLNDRESNLYRSLFGYADFEVPTPAVVKEGDLAPYQELGYITRPLAQEADYIAEQHIRFQELVTRMLDLGFTSLPFLDWVWKRIAERSSQSGARVSWEQFERDSPDLALAALRLCHRFGIVPPDGIRMREQHRQQMRADDWVVLIEDFCLQYLRFSETQQDQDAWEEIRSALPSLGYALTRRGVRRHISPVDRVLSLSASKGVAAASILEVEADSLGDQLRALVLCDYERTNSEMVARLRGVLDPQAGSAVLLLESLLENEQARALSPILVTGRTVACSDRTAWRFLRWITSNEPDLAGRLSWTPVSGGNGPRGTVIITAPANYWTPRRYVPLITRFFEEGHSRCLVGTRGLLGEGWDAKRVNALIDLTTASTSTAVHQMRGRSLRLDPCLPAKVANNWDVVCVDPDHPRGATDYERFVRKHQNYFAPNREGEIESGVSHVHHALSPFGPPDPEQIPAINANLLRRASEREAARERWGIGEPYENQEVTTVRIHTGRHMGLPNRRVLRRDEAGDVREVVKQRSLITGAGAGITALGVGVTGVDPIAFLLPASVIGAGVAWTAIPFHRVTKGLAQSDNLEDFSKAVLEGLRDAGDLPDDLTEDNLYISIQEDGFYRCYITGVTDEQSALFAQSLDEVLAPLSAPRYIIPRYVSQPPGTLVRSITAGIRLVLRGRPGSSAVYHTVPEALARNRQRASAFERAWNRHVSPGQALYYRNNEAKSVLRVQAGEDPFDVTTQIRVLWR